MPEEDQPAIYRRCTLKLFFPRMMLAMCFASLVSFAQCDEVDIDTTEPTSVLVINDIPPVRMVSLSQVAGAEKEEPLPPAATMFIKGIAVALLPETYSDDDDWGATKKIQSGLNVKLDGLKLDTSRRWKDVKHGTWQRVDATLVDPEQHFDLAISLLPKVERGVPRYRVRAKLRLRATGRQQRWNLGAKLYSLSADVVADVAFTADLYFRTELVKSEEGSKLRVLPHLENATAYLDGFSLRSLGHSKGGAVREVGNIVESIIKRSIKRKNPKLATKINAKIQKKPERFEVPAGILAIFGETPDESKIKPSDADSIQ